jgi:hypothetical protein
MLVFGLNSSKREVSKSKTRYEWQRSDREIEAKDYNLSLSVSTIKVKTYEITLGKDVLPTY